MENLVVAITGASGSIYAVRLLEVLIASGKRVHLTISPAAKIVLHRELGVDVNLENFEPSQLVQPRLPIDQDSKLATLERPREEDYALSSVFSDSQVGHGELVYHHFRDFNAGIASGSFLTRGMVICPCSMGTLSSLANGLSSNLIHRAADVHLKERRKLIVIPRETPLGTIQLENMHRLSQAGCVILPARPGFYHQPQSIQDLVDFVVGRICDQLGIHNALMNRWGEPELPES